MRVDPHHVDPRALAAAADWLRAGRIVAFPTDTFYGLAVDPASARAVDALFTIKGRPATMAVPLIAGSIETLRATCALSRTTERLANKFWPGPLSLIVDAPVRMAPSIHGGHGTIAVRVPANSVAVALADAFGGLLTATSANRTGEPPAVTASELDAWAADDRMLVLDGGKVPGGRPSTIVDARGDAPILIREGALDWDRVLESLHE